MGNAMEIKFFDINGNIVNQRDPQDKGFWCKSGAAQEQVFVEKFGNSLGLIINPSKKTDPYAPDLKNTANGLPADLKTQNTPFFMVRSMYGFDPQYTVVFNRGDRIRYKAEYPEIEIYFAVDWQIVKFQGRTTIVVAPMKGVWYIPFRKLDQLLEHAPLHYYKGRKYDQKGNARDSYVLNLLDKAFVKVK